MTLLLPPAGALQVARTYLLGELAMRGNPLPVGIVPPGGEPRSYALISRAGGKVRDFLADYQIRVRVYDADAVNLEANTDLLHQLMLQVNHHAIDIDVGQAWVTASTQSSGPATYDDPDVPLFGNQFAVFWTFGLRPERATGS